MKQQQQVHFGADGFKKIATMLDSLSADRVFFVVDAAAYTASGAADEIERLLVGRSVERFVGFESNPKLEDVERGIEQFRGSNPDVVIAVGGGTAIDLAKLIGTLAVHKTSARDIITGTLDLEVNGPPLIVVPTTAGTGSEATHFAVVYIEEKKYSLAAPRLLPACVVIDSRLTHSLPASITTATGLDAFCQSVESIWAVDSTDESVSYASESVRLAIEHLPVCVQNPTPESRDAMCRAAHLSGKAINISKTTAPHAISYAITTRYGVPHGVAVALTLGEVLKFNAKVGQNDCTDPRGAEHVHNRIALLLELLDQPTVEGGVERIRSLIDSVGAPLRLRDAGVQDEGALAWIAEQVNVERLANNPREIARQDIEKILEEIW